MAFQTVDVNLTGPSYQARSRPLSSQSTINFYQEFDESGKSPFTLQSFPGETVFSAGVGPDRGSEVMAEVDYRVFGTSLFEISVTGARINRGTISGSDRCIIANDGANMFLVHDGLVDQYNSSTKLITAVTDNDIVGSIAVDFINSQFIYTKPDLFIISDVGDGSSASGLNAAQAESQPDDLVRAYVFQQIAYMFGVHSTEPWYNSGSGLPPFIRIDPQIFPVGLGAIHSLARNDTAMYWLGDDRQVYQSRGGGAFDRISTIAIAHAIENYDVVDDAIGFTFTLEGQNFYVLHFPTANATWCVNEGLGKDGWFQLSAGINGDKYNITSHSYVYGKHLVSHETNGDLLEWDIEAFTNSGDTIKRTRVMSSISGDSIGARGKRIQMSRLEFVMEMGVGLVSGQGVDPKIMIEASYDGGRSFHPGTWMRIGRLGETDLRAEWYGLKVFRDLIIRITTSDPVLYAIQSGAIDIRLAGR